MHIPSVEFQDSEGATVGSWWDCKDDPKGGQIDLGSWEGRQKQNLDFHDSNGLWAITNRGAGPHHSKERPRIKNLSHRMCEQ